MLPEPLAQPHLGDHQGNYEDLHFLRRVFESVAVHGPNDGQQHAGGREIHGDLRHARNADPQGAAHLLVGQGLCRSTEVRGPAKAQLNPPVEVTHCRRWNAIQVWALAQDFPIHYYLDTSHSRGSF